MLNQYKSINELKIECLQYLKFLLNTSSYKEKDNTAKTTQNS